MKYYVLENSILYEITLLQSNEFEKNNTFWYSWDWIRVYHLDYDKIKPLVKSILEGEPERESSLMMYIGIFSVVAVLFFLWYYYFISSNTKEVVEDVEITSFPDAPVLNWTWRVVLPWVNNVIDNSTIENNDDLVSCIDSKNRLSSELSLSTQKNLIWIESLRSQLEFSSTTCQIKVDTLNAKINSIESELLLCPSSDTSHVLQDSLNTCSLERDNLKQFIATDKTELVKFLWDTLFKKCSVSSSADCQKVFNEYYKLNK